MLTTIKLIFCAILFVMGVFAIVSRYEWSKKNKDGYPIKKEHRKLFESLLK